MKAVVIAIALLQPVAALLQPPPIARRAVLGGEALSPIARRTVFVGALSAALLLEAPVALAASEGVITPQAAVATPDAAKKMLVEQSTAKESSGKVNGMAATMVAGEDAEALKRAAAAMPELDIPAGSDLERMLSDDGAARSVSSPRAHGN